MQIRSSKGIVYHPKGKMTHSKAIPAQRTQFSRFSIRVSLKIIGSLFFMLGYIKVVP
jgi:hypothetical protein